MSAHALHVGEIIDSIFCKMGYASVFNQLLKAPAAFVCDNRGTIASGFATLLVPATLMVGCAVDYTRALAQRSTLQHAVDSAVLAAALHSAEGSGSAQAAGSAAFAANFPDGGSVVITQPTARPGVTRGEATATVDTSFLRIGGIMNVPIGATAESKAFSNASAIEIALVLDNTGSMSNDMLSLKAAATNLTNTLFNSAQGNPNFKMSVVPYVAAVNPGKTFLSANNYQFMDTTASASIHGGNMRWAYIATNLNCTSNWGGGTSSGGGGTGDKGVSLDPLGFFGRFANELFGISSAYAFDETPNTTPVLSGATVNRSPRGMNGNGEFRPNGFTVTIDGKGTSNSYQGCDWLQNPGTINYFDLFARIPVITKTGGTFTGWKGCVLARSAPYDVTDDAPGTDPSGLGLANTKFVPYFALDEADPFDTWVPAYANNYMDDGYVDVTAVLAVNKILADPTGIRAGRSDNNKWDFKWNNWSRTYSVLKYNGVNKADIKDYYNASGKHVTTGPNSNCPDEVLPLTNVKADVLAKINSLQQWAGGGTMTSEGLAWGWRTISPNLPYAMAKPYGLTTAQKVIVLMTDGVNEVAGNNDDYGPIVSDFSAYGFLSEGRMGSTFAAAKTFLNGRMTQVCNNAKAKPGVSIYTVLFRETDPNIKTLLASCATSPDMAFVAADGASLAAAFAKIGTSISNLRLTQ